jgi:hypothetical protein
MRWRRLEVGWPHEAGREGDGGGGVLSLMILLGRRCVAQQQRKCIHYCLPHEGSTQKGHFRPPPFQTFPSGPWHIRSIQQRSLGPGK